MVKPKLLLSLVMVTTAVLFRTPLSSSSSSVRVTVRVRVCVCVGGGK